MARNQTISYLMKRLAEVGIQPDSRHGQNFLIDLNLLKILADTAQLGPEDVVLEVGTGTGALTHLMSERAGHVVSVEIDKHLYELASEELIDQPNVTLLNMDALKNKNLFRPELHDTIRSVIAAGPGRRQFKLAANLPYSIATPVLSNLLLHDPVPVTMTATIQKELADRIFAQPGTSDYSSLSVWMQAQCRGEIVRVLPPTVFWPRPKVTSAIIHLEVDQRLRGRIPDLVYFHQFVRAMFIHRRKFLRSNLLGAFGRQLEKPEVDTLMAGLELGPTSRAEELSVERFLELAERVRALVPEWRL